MAEIDRDFLRELPLFRGLDDAELYGVTRAIEPRHCPTDAVLFEAGEPSDGAYVVHTGELCAELALPDGAAREVARFGPGAVVGEVCLVADERRGLRVRATRSTTLYRIDRDRFDALRRVDHGGAYKIIRNITLTLCDRLRDTNVRIGERWHGRAGPAAAELSGGVEQPRDVFSRLRRLFGR